MFRAAARRIDSEQSLNGFAVAYDQDELRFPVWILLILTSLLLYMALSHENVVLVLLGLSVGGFAFHNLPLLETGKIRVAANHTGLLIDGLGLLGWRFVKSIDLAEVVVRGTVYKEANIALSEPLSTALLYDARDLALHRRLMRKPFYLKSGPTIRIPLDIFDRPPDDIIASLMRLWTYYRGVR